MLENKKYRVTFISESEKEKVLYDYDEFYKKDEKGKYKLNEPLICEALAKTNNLVYCGGKYYNEDGEVDVYEIRRAISELLVKFGLTEWVNKRTTSILASMQDFTPYDKLKVKPYVIPLINGDLHYLGENEFKMYEEKKHSLYRLNVELKKEKIETPYFDKWLTELIYEEDIPLVQEMLGYFLLPTTKAQKCFVFLGGGGNGKSIWGYLLESMFGKSYTATPLHQLEENKFSLSELRNKLVSYDDDLGKTGLKSTETFKKVVSATAEIRTEEKYAHAIFVPIYARIIASSNYMPTSLYDDSDGFFRRIIGIQVKPRPEDRVDITDLHERVAREKEGILQWALEGLARLVMNNYKFSESERSKDLLYTTRDGQNNIKAFVDDDLIFDTKLSITSKDLYKAYQLWCRDNGEDYHSATRFKAYFKDKMNELNIKDTCNVKTETGHARGFLGVSLKVTR